MVEAPVPALPSHPFPERPEREDFGASELPIEFQWLRTPRPDDIFSLTARPGHLRLYGRETIGSLFHQALVARRQQSHTFSAATSVDVNPQHFQQAAGLVCYYNSSKFHYLYISHDNSIGRHICVMSCLPDQVQSDAFITPIPITAGVRVHMRAEVDCERLQFAYRLEGEDWRWLPQIFDASILSDEATAPGLPNFTGAFVGMCCQDTEGTRMTADFDYFEYRQREYQPQPFGSGA
jgi:xylan 1,4-beta-xylosidase